MAVLPFTLLLLWASLSPSRMLTWVTATWSVVALLGASLALAIIDHSVLRDRGFERLPSPMVAVALPLAYLVVRGNRTFERSFAGYGPAWLHGLGTFLVVGSVLRPFIGL